MNPKHALRQARYERACWWLAQGIDVVPLKPQSKELQPGYGAHRAHITRMDFARQWFLNTDANLGVVLGGTKQLIVIDWDDAHQYEAWRATLDIAVKTLTEQTARGYHMFFTGKGFHSTADRGCELKATGVCMVAPSVHPSGVVYRVLKDGLIARLDCERARILFPFLSEESQEQQRRDGERASAISAPSTRKSHRPAAGVIARIKTAYSILDEMRAAGVQLREGSENVLVGLCPFHQDHTPSLWVNSQSGLWGCNKPDCRAAGTHDVINFRAMRCSISNDAAIRQLAHEFLPFRE